MHLEPRTEQSLQQGDIIQDVPFVVISGVFNVKANNVQGQSRVDCGDASTLDKVKQFSQGNALTVSSLPFAVQPGIVVTQGCDIDHRDFITLARIFPLDLLIQEVKEAIKHDEPLIVYDLIRRLTEGHDYPHLLYLGALDGKNRYAADLLRVQSFPQPWKECFHQKRWKTLTNDGLMYVQARLSFLAGRFATQQGFWHTLPEDGESAAQLARSADELDQARARLEQKVAGIKPDIPPAPPTP